MRRLLAVSSVCAIGLVPLAIAGAAEAKAAKVLRYEWCGSVSGCGLFLLLDAKTKTWQEEGGPYHGSYQTGSKGLLVLHAAAGGCTTELHRVKRSRNYTGAETGPSSTCYPQSVELIRI